jgi:hypothetical protein
MKVLVVYESMFGNTADVAEAIARGARASRCAELHGVSAAEAAEADLLVVGGPTHAFSMSRPSTRHSAREQGAEGALEDRGIREWLADLPTRLDTRAATFDTRVAKVKRLPGSAAKGAAKELRHHTDVLSHESFYVADTAGPLLPGELQRAEAWGARLVTALVPAEMHEDT